jgi:hypothetical protein
MCQYISRAKPAEAEHQDDRDGDGNVESQPTRDEYETRQENVYERCDLQHHVLRGSPEKITALQTLLGL